MNDNCEQAACPCLWAQEAVETEFRAMRNHNFVYDDYRALYEIIYEVADDTS